MKKFKKGQWLIRKWSKENGGETDLVRFEKHYNEAEFTHSHFSRFKDDKLNYVYIEGQNNIDDYELEYKDSRLSMQLRPCTKKEYDKFAKIILPKYI